MTAVELYKNVLTEINKLGAPSLLLEDFIYFANKAVQQYSNKAYNKFEINQQASDDLRVLKASAVLSVKNNSQKTSPVEDLKYYCILPADYMHLLNCVIAFKPIGSDDSDKQCGSDDDDSGYIYSPARRLTSDQYPNIIKNAYFKPTPQRPYYILNNADNNITSFPEANEIMKPSNTEMDGLINSLLGNDRKRAGRHSNTTPVIMEIRCGKTNNYIPSKVYVDYLKSPMRIELTEDEFDGVDKNSQVLEFPDYVCYEIVNEITKLVLENSSDPRLNTNLPINATIPSVPMSTDNKS